MKHLTGFATHTGVLLLTLATGCSERSSTYSVQEFELTAEQLARQIVLLDQALEAHERGEFVGAKVADYKELFDLADSRVIRDRDSVPVTYVFDQAATYSRSASYSKYPDRLKNDEGPGTFIVHVKARRIERLHPLFYVW